LFKEALFFPWYAGRTPDTRCNRPVNQRWKARVLVRSVWLCLTKSWSDYSQAAGWAGNTTQLIAGLFEAEVWAPFDDVFASANQRRCCDMWRRICGRVLCLNNLHGWISQSEKRTCEATSWCGTIYTSDTKHIAIASKHWNPSWWRVGGLYIYRKKGREVKEQVGFTIVIFCGTSRSYHLLKEIPRQIIRRSATPWHCNNFPRWKRSEL